MQNLPEVPIWALHVIKKYFYHYPVDFKIGMCMCVSVLQILCIHLKRFRHELMFSTKISTHVSFPLEGLDLQPFLAKDSFSQTTSYDLLSLICHHGTASSELADLSSFGTHQCPSFISHWIYLPSRVLIRFMLFWIIFLFNPRWPLHSLLQEWWE